MQPGDHTPNYTSLTDVTNVLPPGYREEGWEGLTDIMKALIDVVIEQAYLAFGIPPESPHKAEV